MNTYTYVRNTGNEDHKHGSNAWNNWPCFIVDAETLPEADKEFNEASGLKVSKLSHIGVRWERKKQ